MSVIVNEQQPSATVPVIVASYKLTGQSGALSNTTIYTPAAGGLYRLDYYLALAATGVANVTPQLTFTDDFNSEVVGLHGTASSFGQANAQCVGDSFTFKAAASVAIQIATTVASGSTPTYNLYATLVQL